MNKNKFILSIGTGMLLVNGAFANHTDDNVKPFDISTIEYIEEEIEIDLGFDTAEYLPEGFDPYKIYVDLNAITFITEEVELNDLSEFLPEGFDAYAAPTDVQSINFIDENDDFEINFNTKKHLPEGFDPYIK
jgi:hypothetical protein